VAIVAVVVGGSVGAYAAHGNAPDEYRTATAALGDVQQVLALSGTVDLSGRSDLSFGTSGTVATLSVGVGDKVTRGEVLARLDTTALKAAVTQANATLAAARAQLAKDEDAQTSTVTSSASTGSTGATANTAGTASTGSTGSTASTGGTGSITGSKTGSGSSGASLPSNSDSSHASGSSTGSSAALTKALAQLAAQQHAVEVAQTAVDAAITAAQAATKQEETACSAGSSSSTSASATADPSDGAGTATDDSGTGTSDACEAAIVAVQSAQQAVADAEYTGSGNLKDALAALAASLSDAAKVASTSSSSAQAGGATTGGTAGSSSKSPGSTSTTSGSTQQTQQPATSQQQSGQSTQSSQSAQTSQGSQSLSTGVGSQTVTAATLAKDEASIDAAKASLIEATQALSGAVIKAPAAGTVGQVSVTRGGSATGGSTAVVVIAPGTSTVALSVSSTQVAELKVGQKAQVTPAGSDRAYPATVTRISRIPDSSSDTTTYPVTVTLDQKGLDLLAGATAAVDVTLGSATGVLTVPTSALSNGSVEVYDDGDVSRVRVTTGLVGRSRTVITDGLKAGQKVVLADVSSDLPTSDSSTSNRSFGGASFAGGGFSGGGFSGGFGG